MRPVLARVADALRRLLRAIAYERNAFLRTRPIRRGTVLYESFDGNGVLDNPEAIFREVLASPDLAHLSHTWVLDGRGAHAAVRAEFAGHPRVRFVSYRSGAYFHALASHEYLVNNATFPPEFGKRPGQIYLNTWHGTPLKQMGFDMPDGAVSSANTLRNLVSADYLLSQNEFMTDTMYGSAYKLAGLYRGTIIEEGYPRTDRQFADEHTLEAARASLAAAGVATDGQRIVLYAPTWKGSSFSSPADDIATLVSIVERLQAGLDARTDAGADAADRYVVLLKTHQVVHRFAATDAALRRILVPNDLPTNLILGMTDTLVTDYSSIFFDYLSSGRRILFYTPDDAEYTETRGTYFAPAELPGPVFGTVDELASAIAGSSAPDDLDPDRFALYRQWRARFTPHDDGDVSRRVVDVVFRGQRGYRLRSLAPTAQKTSLLVHVGGMRSNGITTSLLNLLNSIDHERYDVSALMARPRSIQQSMNQERINPNVRRFVRVGGMNGSKILSLRRRLTARRAMGAVHRESPSHRRVWDDEWHRCFGSTRFDAVIDFSGYSAFWATLLLHSPEAVRSIWLHNDMAAETHRRIGGRKRMLRSLPAVFSLYDDFDSLVSVSPSLMDVNRRGLGEYGVAAEKFTFARNLIDDRRVLAGAGADIRHFEDHPRDPETNVLEPLEWVDSILAADDCPWFATVGRFSPEKNQARLIRAFAAVHADYPSTRLIIIGYGSLRDALEADIARLGLVGVAFVVGPYDNPFAILARADCFVLSSDYEGQPMVLLEAAILGLPIVSVEFESVHDALPDSSLRIVDQTDDALAEGMRAFCRGEVAPAELDGAAYNAEAVREFHAATLPATP